MKRNDKTVDLRIIKTKKAIRDAFLALIEEKGFERISVKEITEKAMISRNTFYLHYSDKNDLFNKICDDLMRTLFLRAGKQLRRVQQNEFTLASVASIIKSTMAAVDDDREEYRVFFSDSDISGILTLKINTIARRFLDLIKDDIEGISEWSMAYTVSGFSGVIRYHVLHGAEDLDAECQNFTKIHLKSIIEIARNSRNGKNKDEKEKAQC